LAAQKLGLTHVPVRLLDLIQEDAQLLALADNRLGEIAEWNEDGLARVLADIKAADVNLSVTGFDGKEIRAGASVPGVRAISTNSRAAGFLEGLGFEVAGGATTGFLLGYAAGKDTSCPDLEERDLASPGEAALSSPGSPSLNFAIWYLLGPGRDPSQARTLAGPGRRRVPCRSMHSPPS
jgi:hypothetical protein